MDGIIMADNTTDLARLVGKIAEEATHPRAFLCMNQLVPAKTSWLDLVPADSGEGLLCFYELLNAGTIELWVTPQGQLCCFLAGESGQRFLIRGLSDGDLILPSHSWQDRGMERYIQ